MLAATSIDFWAELLGAMTMKGRLSLPVGASASVCCLVPVGPGATTSIPRTEIDMLAAALHIEHPRQSCRPLLHPAISPLHLGKFNFTTPRNVQMQTSVTK